jgi:hypothetical protein
MGKIGNKSKTGMVFSLETRRRISEGLKGNKCGIGNKSRTGWKNSPESIAKCKATWEEKRKLCKSVRLIYRILFRELCPIQQLQPRHRHGRSNKGMKLSEETKQKMSIAKKGKPHPAHDKMVAMLRARKGYHHTEESKLKMSETRKGKGVTPQCLAKATEANTGRVKSEEEKAKMRAYWAEHKEQQREIGRAAWKDPEKVKIMVSNQRKARQRRPNHFEEEALRLLDKHFPNEWEYVGNGGLILGTKCPDFVRNHGHNQVIELYGDYWHRGENPQDRIDEFDKYGYQTLVIWQADFKKMKEKGFAETVLKFMQTANLLYYNPNAPQVNQQNEKWRHYRKQ